MHGGPELTVALLAALALAAGAAVRLLSRRLRFPFTIAMLLLGVGAGLGVHRLGDHEGGIVAEALRSGANIGPELIIFVFLPALIFESAYSIDVHAFRKDVGGVVLLALPALVVTTGLTAAGMLFLTGAVGWGWGWAGALVFGALISATDPVAVVAVLRDVGAPRRLSILIEGESLFNDGTAIVLYTVLVGLLTGASTELAPGPVGLEFLWVVAGGLGVGLILALIATSWIGRTFNDPMVEITLTIALAYAAMIVAEGLLHVSGVMAVVVAGLFLSGPGRTRISPEVLHFLHRFWGMLSYVANTLIFFLVGLCIAFRVDHAPAGVVLVILLAYLAILVIRLVVTFSFRPLMKVFSAPVSRREGAVMAWGGLRGAVSLALALAVSSHPDVPQAIGDQILVVTAGVVLLTILVNGTTTGWLLRRLGFTDVPPAEALADLSVETNVLDEIGERIETAADNRDLRRLPWSPVREELDGRRTELTRDIERRTQELSKDEAPELEHQALLRRGLEIERHAYWRAYAEGILGATATRVLDHEVELQLDRLAEGDTSSPPGRIPDREGLRARVGRVLRSFGFDFGGIQLSHLTLVYDLCRGQALGAEALLRELPGAGDAHDAVRAVYVSYLRDARERLEDIRTNLPEVARVIEDRLTRRIALNFERSAFEERAELGLLGVRRAGAAATSVQRRMKDLSRRTVAVPLPETAELCRHAALFAGLKDDAFAELAEITIEEAHPKGTVLCEEGERASTAFVIGRGAVHVLKKVGDQEVLVDVLGGGELFGEMALLSDDERHATCVTGTAVTLGKISRDDFEKFVEEHPQIRERIWREFERRLLDNLARGQEGFEHTSHDDRVTWADAGRSLELEPDEERQTAGSDRYLLVVRGAVTLGGERIDAPRLHVLDGPTDLAAAGDARVVLLPTPP